MRTELLRRTETSSYCNYKGFATYWSAVGDDGVIDDVAWSYPDPPPESLPIKGFLSFDDARADVVAELPLPVVGTPSPSACWAIMLRKTSRVPP